MDADPNALDSAGFPSSCCGRGECSECPMVRMVRSVFVDGITGRMMTLDEVARALLDE